MDEILSQQTPTITPNNIPQPPAPPPSDPKQLNDVFTNILQNSTDTTSAVFNLAQQIDISWIEIVAKLCIAAIIILVLKEIIFSIHRYICIRMDKYIGIGTIVKFENNTYGTIKDYNLRNVSLSTKDGIVKIPLEVWLSTYYVQVSNYNIDVEDFNNLVDNVKNMLKSSEENQEAKLKYLYDELVQLKGKNPTDNVDIHYD